MKKLTKRIIAVMFALLFAVIGTTSAFALTACSDCGRIFESNSAYSVHTRICKPETTRKITYVCSYCEAMYETKAMFSSRQRLGLFSGISLPSKTTVPPAS